MRVVADIMTPNPVTVTPRNAIRTAINLMREGGYRRLPVVDRGRLVGIITDRDLRRAANSPFVVREQWYDNFILDHIEVGSCMTPEPLTIEPDCADRRSSAPDARPQDRRPAGGRRRPTGRHHHRDRPAGFPDRAAGDAKPQPA